ncbi:unnamed protein product [Rotaria sp. Silwood1]|nr:unnamed protein product [Rotaria sp. Silwood1]
MYSLTNRYESTAIPSLPDYAFGEKLGAGSYGTVYKARLISNIQSRPSSAACNRPTSARPTSALPTFYAIKCINRKVLTKTTEDLLINEIKTLKDIKHENIVEMYDFQWDENYIYIVTEYCAGVPRTLRLPCSPICCATPKSDIPIEIPNDAQISPECRNLLENLLQRNPDKRISFPDFFRHPFICLDVSPQIAHADNTLQQAINYEQSGDFKKALDYRVQALDEYLAIIKVDEDADRRRMLRMKVKQGVVVAEDLKKRIKEATTNSESTPSVTTTSLLPSPSTSPSDDLDLNNDKELFDAYQHCLNGNQLMNAFMFARACEEYEIGLDVMLRVARTETDPTKIKILRNMIIHYLNKAESCKQRCETQRLDLAIEKIKQDSENDTTIMNESTYEEKKQRSPLQQTCHLQ